MQILFVRHAESVDNVANLFGGSRDAALTAHGVLQAQRLASSLLSSKLDIKHVFASNLQRAEKTAAAICDAFNETEPLVHQLKVQQLSDLRERHFGNWEGVRFGTSATSQRPVQTGAESLESMRRRADAFLDQHLLPLLQDQKVKSEKACIIVVSHGIMLHALTRALTSRSSREKPGVGPHAGRNQLSAVKPSWSNTGYLNITVTCPTATSPQASSLSDFYIRVLQTNCTNHLDGLRRTRGGIGRAAFDKNQRTIDGFFLDNGSRKRKAKD